ncbi:MAG: hypothetical protein LBD57_04370 [Endomicrobium sp.]|jgi:hypothetical protein|uniref:hypothetical protein n=1 Tax=Candidatus Endomicrobiellum cubanum TaxID=3242325 RepID=UPI002820BA45|nr:hypothetical protein [Endomicrobium sp.]
MDSDKIININELLYLKTITHWLKQTAWFDNLKESDQVQYLILFEEIFYTINTNHAIVNEILVVTAENINSVILLFNKEIKNEFYQIFSKIPRIDNYLVKVYVFVTLMLLVLKEKYKPLKVQRKDIVDEIVRLKDFLINLDLTSKTNCKEDKIFNHLIRKYINILFFQGCWAESSTLWINKKDLFRTNEGYVLYCELWNYFSDIEELIANTLIVVSINDMLQKKFEIELSKLTGQQTAANLKDLIELITMMIEAYFGEISYKQSTIESKNNIFNKLNEIESCN